ncbi:UDP-glucose 4-epimerase GalE [Leuconostoc carnosum]|uniref:UDP-glucose 4-epimerase n=2 Tax=Leuconostoc carnosum TaxID=1252 RepID=K0DB67_LEUCJ|nr:MULTISPECIES: UDP-glucose 4-epimerase GalE [Leuconostoc]AFT81156.1 UDP-glucose 4-epimerase [Leuconostoc carnosum JB16]KAA8326495.1 UDP-glucose 4-epimerase GalE [Leuconostoc carnosum]KAA8330753.1 UDP-glucose 4-epimerase GalE [Leuconostoc carnosum]KAA8362054.1 UDP-glucose 4-epimerase GalE [Leuconostoc carnosum]KAA8366603.1 UDP-glucose 4-epimerase GalE [Leuconostoc carnosum]
MSVLVLGGAGYIGSHMVKTLVEAGRDVVVVDALFTGHRAAVNPKAKFYQVDIRDKDALSAVFDQENIEQVVHFAAFSIVPESVANPLKYFDNNTSGMITLLEVMNDHNVKQIVFSSTAATYGNPVNIPIKETDPQNPINPYGESKLMMEKIMAWSDLADGIKWVALRYFNVAGAAEDASIGEDHTPETHLVPIILQAALGQRDYIEMFGDDYNTPDGFNVRDYVHVLDLADAHLRALKYLADGNDSNQFNLGSATGFSVKEMVESARTATGVAIPSRIGPRRAGDPDILIANSDKARDILGWAPKYDNVQDIIKTAWNWHQSHPKGYDDKN